MAEENEKIGFGCIVSLLAIPVLLVSLFTGNELIQSLAVIAGSLGLLVEAIKAIIAKEKETSKSKRSDADIVSELLTREYKQKEEELQKELAAKQSELEQLEKKMTDPDNLGNINEKSILIRKDQFEAAYNHLKETCDFIWGICKETEFQEYIAGNREPGGDKIDNSKQLFTSLKFFIIKDILRSYERLGHKYYSGELMGKKICELSTTKPEGQLLYSFIQQMMQMDSNRRATWNDFRQEIGGSDIYNRQIRNNTKKALGEYANADVHATASNGLDDFEFCIVLHNYSEKYEKIYRVKMLRIATLIAKADDVVTPTESVWLESIMKGGTIEEEIAEETRHEENRVREDEQLDSLIGLQSVKTEITTLRNFVTMRQRREQAGMKSPNISYHCVFTGNPGTGKTTVARILANIYKDLGILKKGHLVETDRSGLVAEYVGQTAVKTNKIIDKALDGILFIDEAYTLANGSQNDYGAEAIATLLKRMEDDRDRLVVILTGYTKEIEQFISSNPGLRSRFNRYIEFPDYSAEELYDIFCLQARKNEFELSEGASERLMLIIKNAVAHKDKDFGNARYVRNLFERSIEAQANRLASQKELSKKDLALITGDDIPTI